MSTIGFLLAPRGDLGGAIAIVPAIDGIELTNLVHTFEKSAGMETRTASSYGGLIPSYFDFGPLPGHYLGNSRVATNGKTPVLGCSCGEWGCWPLLVRIVADARVVTWRDFEQPFRKERDYGGFGPFSFARAEYEAALEALRQALAMEL